MEILDEKFIINNEVTQELIRGNFEEFPEVKNGVWSCVQRDYRFMFFKYKTLKSIINHTDAISNKELEATIAIWIDGKCFIESSPCLHFERSES